MANSITDGGGLLIQPGTLRLLGGPGVVVQSKGGARVAGQAGSFALKYRAVERLGAALHATPPQLMRVLDINERTAQRRKEQGALSADESDRLSRIARVTLRAFDAFGDEDQARIWLRRSNRALGGTAPLELLGTDAGAERVSDELGRIDHGDLY